MRLKRAADKAAGKTAAKPLPETPSDPAQALCEWAKKSLKVPPGHPREGRPFEIPAYGEAFLRDAMADDCREALLCLGRKNAKSAIVAVLVLGYLAGPLKRAGFRAGVASISKEKAGELTGANRSDSDGFQRPQAASFLAAFRTGDYLRAWRLCRYSQC